MAYMDYFVSISVVFLVFLVFPGYVATDKGQTTRILN